MRPKWSRSRAEVGPTGGHTLLIGGLLGRALSFDLQDIVRGLFGFKTQDRPAAAGRSPGGRT